MVAIVIVGLMPQAAAGIIPGRRRISFKACPAAGSLQVEPPEPKAGGKAFRFGRPGIRLGAGTFADELVLQPLRSQFPEPLVGDPRLGTAFQLREGNPARQASPFGINNDARVADDEGRHRDTADGYSGERHRLSFASWIGPNTLLRRFPRLCGESAHTTQRVLTPCGVSTRRGY